MNISYFEDKEEAFIIIGSNGLIGGYISQEIKRVACAKNYKWKQQLLVKLESYDDIEGQTLNILKTQAMKRVTCCTVFCAHGRGGFNLKNKAAVAQYNQFIKDVDNTSTIISYHYLDSNDDDMNISSPVYNHNNTNNNHSSHNMASQYAAQAQYAKHKIKSRLSSTHNSGKRDSKRHIKHIR